MNKNIADIRPSALNAKEEQLLETDDLILLAPLRNVKPVLNGNDTAAKTSEVSWMRNSALFTRKAAARSRQRTAMLQRFVSH